jgi:hypothetical protein
MELSTNWKAWDKFFSPRRRSAQTKPAALSRALYLVLEEGVVVSAYSEGEDLSDWLGCSVEELGDRLAHREVVALDRKDWDAALLEARSKGHLDSQIEYLRTRVESELPRMAERVAESKALGVRAPATFRSFQNRSFLLQSLEGWWLRVLPQSFGVWLRLEGQASSDLLLLYRNGKLEQFLEPDLTTLGTERSSPEEITKLLSERFALPVQGVVIPAQDWFRWTTEGQDPWREVWQAFRAGRVELAPRRLSVQALIGCRAVLGY